MNDFEGILNATAPLRRLYALRNLPWQFGQTPVQISTLYQDGQHERRLDEVGCCVQDNVFYLGLFRQDGSAVVAAMPGYLAEGLAHFIHFDLLGGQS